MTPYYADDLVTLYAGDCLDVMRDIPDASVDSVVTDPPYGLEFMGKDWDRPWAQDFTSRMGSLPLPDRQLHVNPRCLTCGGYQRGTKNPCRCSEPRWSDSQANAVRRVSQGFQAWCELWAAECLRVLKPGGHMLSFGGTRTYHRLACAVEDAGFEIRDSITWLYGSGFPKSLDVSKAIDRAAGAEREVIGSKIGLPGYSLTDGNGDHRTYGRGLGNTGSGEAEAAITAPATPAARQWAGWGTALKPASEPIVVARKPLRGTVAANVLAYGTGALNIAACRVGKGLGAGTQTEPAGRWPPNVVLDESQADALDRESGLASYNPSGIFGKQRGSATKINDVYGHDKQDRDVFGYGDSGGPSRFFPTFRYEAKAPTHERPRDAATAHPTVKPVDLMRWLVRLVTPPGGICLDPFSGSGTTAEACVVQGFRCILIEREPTYLPLIVARLSKPIQPDLFGGAA